MTEFITINEIVQLPLLANDDILQRGKGRMLKWAKYVFQDLNLDVLKETRRQYFQINKKTNSVDLPCPASMVSSVNIVDAAGTIYPVWKNGRLHPDIADVSAAKDCACEYKCGHKLCNLIKGYKAVVSTKTDKLPDGEDISFTCVDRKGVVGDTFYEETQYPLRVYLSGVWTDTILYTEKRELCKVEIDKNGCVCDTNSNIENVCNTCCGSTGTTSTTLDNQPIPVGGTSLIPPCPEATTWMYYCNSKLDWFSIQCGNYPYCRSEFDNIYNITDSGNRLVFPANFGFDKVLIRFYQNQNLKDIKIPMIAVDTFVSGLKWWDVRWNDRKQNLAVKYEMDYTKLKWGLLGELNKYRIAELKMMTTPPVYMPSYIQPGTGNVTGW